MGDQQVNPFADPNEVRPVFGAATGATAGGQQTGDYNPFAQQQQQQPQPPQNVYAPAATPATIEPTRAEPTFGQYGAGGGVGQYGGGGAYTQDDSMRARQDELERKAAELEKKEAELKNIQSQVGKPNNFPPLPSFCCVGPCYYHDITVEIPMESQKTAKMMFIVWQFYVFCLFFNCISALAALCIGADGGAQLFGVSLLYFVIFPPLSFVVWYRPIYKALRSGSSFNYMLFFFVFFFQAVFTCLYALGMDFLGTCGWINGAGIAASKDTGKEGVSAMFFISGALFTLLAVFKIFLLRKVHTSYRRSGANMEKAKSEFAQGIATNKNVQNAAVTAVSAGVSGAISGGPSSRP